VLSLKLVFCVAKLRAGPALDGRYYLVTNAFLIFCIIILYCSATKHRSPDVSRGFTWIFSFGRHSARNKQCAHQPKSQKGSQAGRNEKNVVTSTITVVTSKRSSKRESDAGFDGEGDGERAYLE